MIFVMFQTKMSFNPDNLGGRMSSSEFYVEKVQAPVVRPIYQ